MITPKNIHFRIAHHVSHYWDSSKTSWPRIADNRSETKPSHSSSRLSFYTKLLHSKYSIMDEGCPLKNRTSKALLKFFSEKWEISQLTWKTDNFRNQTIWQNWGSRKSMHSKMIWINLHCSMLKMNDLTWKNVSQIQSANKSSISTINSKWTSI